MADDIKQLAQAHALEVLGLEQYNTNPDAVESIAGDFEAGYTAAIQTAQPAPLARLAEDKLELEGLRQLSQRQAKILSATAIALRGPEPPLTMWSHHDVAELAADAMARLVQAERPKWLSIEERLPERGVPVLILRKTGEQSVAWLGNDLLQGHADWFWGGYQSQYQATHWQPLPAAPAANAGKEASQC